METSDMRDPGMDAPVTRREEATVAEASDRALLGRFRDGQAEASTRLYCKYSGRLRALATALRPRDLASRVDPEDIVQSVFRTFFRRVAQGHYDVPDGQEIWKLLLVIALNKVRAAGVHHRAAKRDVRLTVGGEVYNLAARTALGHDEVAMTDLRLVVVQALEKLPRSHRAMAELRIEGYDVAEIAQRVRRSKRSVERVLQEFRTRLDALIHEDR
jgi:RNA polymerase sigma-70 factor (ECF subfamily)